MADTSQDEQRKIQEEYQEWKSTTPLLYDLVVTHNLTWPSLTCQWLPSTSTHDNHTRQELLIGTHTNDDETNFAEFLALDIPQDVPDTTGDVDSTAAAKVKMSLTQKIDHPGEVNRARYQPTKPNVFATKTRDGPVHLYDRAKPDQPLQLQLLGHTQEGYGLEWCPHHGKTNHLLSAGFDRVICHWDIEGTPNADKGLSPYQRYEAHTDCVEDISWNASNDTMFASVGDDKKLMIWDCRVGTTPMHQIQAHKAEVNSVAFHPQQGWLLATGSSDKTVALFDMRKLESKLHSFEMHDGEVHQVAWSPHAEPVLASAAMDRKIMLWDLRRIGEEQTPEDAEDGPPELLFVHNGHTSKITEFSWNPVDPWMIASAAEDNVVQVWQVSSKIYASKEQLEVSHVDLE
ncbi:WD40 repeat-like protein [Hesseltinella vesiculosa]|uniref:WD40 repeat-like protein n=1 Tax=Hesseltinella vesiculosa TaxID=101127 RepID=A0A1X2G2F2_9FUNG|nr:WD40 repeat-like protein [Hesseltinella vesiculosa]